MCRGSSSACRKPSENRTRLDPRRARPPPSRAPPHPPPGEAAAPCRRACGPRPACGLAPAWRARAAATLTPARACGVLAWRRRSGLSGKGKSCADGAGPWGPLGAYTCICAVEQGWWPPPLAIMVQVITAQESTCEQNIKKRSCGGALSRVHKYSAPYGEAYRGAIGVCV
jgi:hypothetical protein